MCSYSILLLLLWPLASLLLSCVWLNGANTSLLFFVKMLLQWLSIEGKIRAYSSLISTVCFFIQPDWKCYQFERAERMDGNFHYFSLRSLNESDRMDEAWESQEIYADKLLLLFLSSSLHALLIDFCRCSLFIINIGINWITKEGSIINEVDA